MATSPTRHAAEWFEHARFGMFIHWGPYSQAARGEWVMNRERIETDEYARLYAETWTADKYDPTAWVRLAVEAGMGYVVLTARHHDGFALWDSPQTPFNSVRMGPKRDLVAPLVDAARAAGLKVGLYYSPANWTHPDYPTPFARDWPTVDDWRDESSRQRFVEYYQAEVLDLLRRFAPVDYLWFDGCIPRNIDGPETLALIRAKHPETLINDRLGEPFDIRCCEQAITPAPPGQPWEACLTLNDNWGFHAGDDAWKSPAQVAGMLLTCAQHNGNLLLNIGPRGDGTIPRESVEILRRVGQWLRPRAESLRNTTRHDFPWGNTVTHVTVRNERVFLHVLKRTGGRVCWAELANRVVAARLLDTGRPVAFRQLQTRLFLDGLPDPMPDPIGMTIELEVEGPPTAIARQTTHWMPG